LGRIGAFIGVAYIPRRARVLLPLPASALLLPHFSFFAGRCLHAGTLTMQDRTLNLVMEASVDETVSTGALVNIAVSLGGGQM